MTSAPALLVVDAANVVGSVPDGWWRDRAGAAARLRDALAAVAGRGLPDLDPPLEVVLVVEGAARGVPAVPGVRVVAADGSGDDAIVALVRDEGANRRCAVVTADRGLRARVTALGATVYGPRVLPRWSAGPGGRQVFRRSSGVLADRENSSESGGGPAMADQQEQEQDRQDAVRTGTDQPWEPEDLAVASGQDPTPENVERARRDLEREGPAAIEKTTP